MAHQLCEVIAFPRPNKQNQYSTGYADGLAVGERLAGIRLFWWGTLAGATVLGLALVIALVVSQ